MTSPKFRWQKVPRSQFETHWLLYRGRRVGWITRADHRSDSWHWTAQWRDGREWIYGDSFTKSAAMPKRDAMRALREFVLERNESR